jgi:hypothetical protein
MLAATSVGQCLHICHAWCTGSGLFLQALKPKCVVPYQVCVICDQAAVIRPGGL